MRVEKLLDDTRLSHGVMALCGAAAAGFVAVPRGGVFQTIFFFLPFFMAAAVLSARVRFAPLEVRAPLRLLLIGQGSYLALTLVWFGAPAVFRNELPFPSVLDPLYFGVYATYAIFLAMVLQRRAVDRAVEARVALTDAVILTASISALMWVSVIHPNLTNDTGAVSTTVAVLYQAFPLLLFGLTARLATTAGVLHTTPGMLMLLWIGAEVAGDLFYGFQSVNGTFEHGAPLTTTWMISNGALAALAAHPGIVTLLDPAAQMRPGKRGARTLRRVVRPGVLLVAALVPVGLTTFQDERSIVLLGVSVFTMALVIYRMSILSEDLGRERELAASLDEALARVSQQRDHLARYAAIVGSTDDAIITISTDAVILDWNPGAERLYGYTRDEAAGEHISLIVAPSSWEAAEHALATVLEGGNTAIESVDLHRDGTAVHTSVALSPIRSEDGDVVALVGIARNISARKNAEERAQNATRELELQTQELERVAFQDPVTRLRNRTFLRDRASSGADLRDTALLLLDLDGFKEVNDTLGHAAGDILLLQVGSRLGECVRVGDTVARLGGDEFALLLPDTGRRAALLTAERVLARLRESFSLSGMTVRAQGSIGIAFGSSHLTLDDMLRNADLAMYEAKARGGDRVELFDPTMYDRMARRLQIDTTMRGAMDHEEFAVWYQPIVHAASGEVMCLEALVRWDQPDGEIVAPFEFLPPAERSGLIIELGRFVLRTACADAARWRAVWPNLTIAVNVSHRELLDVAFADNVASVLAETGLPPHALHLEITETVLAAEDDIVQALESLAVHGVQFAIDDFGTGQSSLSRLRDLPVKRLKIDRSFIAEISSDSKAPLLRSIISLAHSLDRVVVAEGVETLQQAAFLIANGCDELQGYLFGRAATGADVPALLSRPQLAPLPLPDSVAVADGPPDHTAFPRLIAGILDRHRPLDAVLGRLLGELAAFAGLDSVFVTDVRADTQEQVTRLAHNASPDVLAVDEGLVVEWDQTLCRRLLDDNVVSESEVGTRYSDVEVARTLGIETYVSVPIRDTTGTIQGTLCAASSESRPVNHSVIGLMRLVAQALAERMATERPAQAELDSPRFS